MKHIKVTGCFDCPRAKMGQTGTLLEEYYFCNTERFDVEPNIINKTIHPDCPLDDIERAMKETLERADK